MAPNAGPWLSPKVVTVNSLPNVLPDMGVNSSRKRRRMGVEFSGAQGKHALAATLEFKPDKGHLGEGSLHMAVRVANFNNQPASEVRCSRASRRIRRTISRPSLPAPSARAGSWRNSAGIVAKSRSST